MRKGIWHQFGDRSQKVALDHLDNGLGEGVIISPRDLAEHKAVEYAEQYTNKGADILFDPQFYIPDSTQGKLDTYSCDKLRNTVSGLKKLTPEQLRDVTTEMALINKELNCSAIIAPACVYEAGRADLVELNANLFAAAKLAGDYLGLPTYASVVFGHSVTQAEETMQHTLSDVTSLNPDGWYFAFEFPPERIPSSTDYVERYCAAGLSLAITRKPVMYAYAGPLALLAPCCGGQAAAIGHSQNLWHFTKKRWEATDGGGGGGNAPARHFSDALWGTIIDPDEVARLSRRLRDRILSDSPFRLPWDRWRASQHLVSVIGNRVSTLFQTSEPREAARLARLHLQRARNLYQEIIEEGVNVKDNANAYQENWRLALLRLERLRKTDLDYLELL